jgi:hypothetical protein
VILYGCPGKKFDAMIGAGGAHALTGFETMKTS